MLPRFSVPRRWQIGVLLLGCSFFVFVSSGLLPHTRAAANVPPDHQVSATPTNIQPKFVASYAKLPLSFEANRGQADARVRFLARAGGYTIFLTGDEAVLEMQESGVRSPESEVSPTDGPARALDRGRESVMTFPLPPNRTGGSPASGSPVGGFTCERTDRRQHER